MHVPAYNVRNLTNYPGNVVFTAPFFTIFSLYDVLSSK